MKLLIHDLSAAEWEQTADLYKGWTIVSDTGGIRPCTGCFRCWTSGSGECVFRDGYNNMCALIHEADEMTVMSRYTYGGFSSFVKMYLTAVSDMFFRNLRLPMERCTTRKGFRKINRSLSGSEAAAFLRKGKKGPGNTRLQYAGICGEL